MKYIFIADFFNIIGGGEFSDQVLRDLIGGEQINIESKECTVHQLNKLKDNQFIISNFIGLSEECKQYLINNCKYIIWEHDHKYLKTRNPSVFKDFKAPIDQLINLDFYKSAKAVVCQTKAHADVVFKNTQLDNIVNFGGSLWSEGQLQKLEDCFVIRSANVGQKDVIGILNSDIIHKGTRETVEYCKKQNLNYELIEITDWDKFIWTLSQYKQFMFFPQIFETCSRMAVEARMLGVKFVGNQLVSAIHEDWFRKYKGLELINYFREKNKGVKQFIEDCFCQKYKAVKQPEIIAILNLYRRPQNLQKQIDALRAQTIPPKEIWVWQNYEHGFNGGIDNIQVHYEPFGKCGLDIKKSFKLKDEIVSGVTKWITTNHNWKYFGRFAMAQMAQCDFVAFYDDDTIPGKEWHENCLKTMKTHDGIMGGVGVILNTKENYHDHVRYGWPTPEHNKIEEADLVGHAWFLKKEWLKYMWFEEPYSYDNFEDGHLSFCAQKYDNIKTYIPVQNTKDNTSSQLGYELGIDEVASSHPKNHSLFYEQRNSAVKEYVKRGWKLVKFKGDK